jgi:hypothetical protein
VDRHGSLSAEEELAAPRFTDMVPEAPARASVAAPLPAVGLSGDGLDNENLEAEEEGEDEPGAALFLPAKLLTSSGSACSWAEAAAWATILPHSQAL